MEAPPKHPVLLAIGGVTFALLVGELVMRIYGGAVFTTANFLEDEINLTRSSYPAGHDPQLGWIPKAPPSPEDNIWKTTVTILPDGIRSNGAPPPSSDEPPILAVGDSMTFGDEVSDGDSWPAILERLIGRRVINGGVFGYGFDQTVLRAEQLVPKYKPAVLIVSVLPDDIARCELSSRTGVSKPYFAIEGEALVQKNVPVPEPVVTYRPGLVRGVLGHSYMINFALTILAPGVWLRGKPDMMIEQTRVHERGPEVACRLVSRLVALRAAHPMRIIVMLQHGRDSTPVEFANGLALMGCVREAGIDGFDVGPSLAAVYQADKKRFDEMFLFFHMSPAGNRWLAELLQKILTSSR